MIYNIDFLVAALVFLVIILYHLLEQHTLSLENSRSFLWLVITGILNICFDLLCTVLITWKRPELSGLTEVCLMILYILQVLVPSALLSHVLAQFSPGVGTRFQRGIVLALMPVCMTLMVVLNHWTGVFFTVESDGTYLRGPMYLLMYGFAGVYLLLSALVAVLGRSVLPPEKVRAVCELVFLAGVTVVVQSFYHDVLLSGFGIAMGITILFFTMNNPYRYVDSLTSAFDVRYFDDCCRHQLERHRQFHLLVVELPQIRRVNSILGVEVGNRILMTTAQTLRSFDRHNRVFRTSGKRFIVMLPGLKQYEELLEQVQAFFKKPVQIDGEAMKVPVSICGVMDAQQLGSSDRIQAYVEYLTALTGASDEVRVLQGDSHTLKGFHYNQEVEQYLVTAIQQNLFEVVYQPVFSISQNRYTSLEALSRMYHPTLGPVSPDVFISIAEKNDQISAIGLLQMRRVCNFLVEHPKILDTVENVKINLSPAELMKTGHVDRLIRMIRSYNLPTSFFQVEITETVATEYSETLNAITEKFTEAGIGLCLDDFGSGYANLNTVLKLPFRVIKLDRSLLFGICQDQRTASLYESIVSSLNRMGFRIIAEGVEQSRELELVSGWGVDNIQGYFFSRPLPGKDIVEMLLNDPE